MKKYSNVKYKWKKENLFFKNHILLENIMFSNILPVKSIIPLVINMESTEKLPASNKSLTLWISYWEYPAGISLKNHENFTVKHSEDH